MTDRRLAGATVAITGGTGSFGSTMVRHLLQAGTDRVHILSRDEAKQEELRQRLSDSRVKFFPGGVRDRHRVDNAIADDLSVSETAGLIAGLPEMQTIMDARI